VVELVCFVHTNSQVLGAAPEDSRCALMTTQRARRLAARTPTGQHPCVPGIAAHLRGAWSQDPRVSIKLLLPGPLLGCFCRHARPAATAPWLASAARVPCASSRCIVAAPGFSAGCCAAWRAALGCRYSGVTCLRPHSVRLAALAMQGREGRSRPQAERAGTSTSTPPAAQRACMHRWRALGGPRAQRAVVLRPGAEQAAAPKSGWVEHGGRGYNDAPAALVSDDAHEHHGGQLAASKQHYCRRYITAGGNMSSQVTLLQRITLHYGCALRRYHGGGNTTFCTGVTRPFCHQCAAASLVPIAASCACIRSLCAGVGKIDENVVDAESCDGSAPTTQLRWGRVGVGQHRDVQPHHQVHQLLFLSLL
jgi:hypothetical protein